MAETEDRKRVELTLHPAIIITAYGIRLQRDGVTVDVDLAQNEGEMALIATVVENDQPLRFLFGDETGSYDDGMRDTDGCFYGPPNPEE